MSEWVKMPTEPGNYLWVKMWSCGCCNLFSGICWVTDTKVNPEILKFPSWVIQGKELCIHFEGCGEFSKPQMIDGVPDVTAYLKIELPPYEWSEIP